MEPKALESRPFVVAAMVFEAALALVALGLGWFLNRPPLAQIDWTGQAIGQGLLATLPLVAGLVLITRYPVGPLKSLDNVVRELLVPLFGPVAIWQFFVISALAGFGEEFLFRGVVQAGIEQFSGSPWLSLAVASLLFGLAHPITAPYVALAGLIGIYLGWLWLATDNLLVPIVTHGAYDFVALLYLTRRQSNRHGIGVDPQGETSATQDSHR